MKKQFILAAATALAWASPGQAQSVLAGNPDTVVQALQAAGYRAQLGRDEQGNPQIESAANGSNFVVYFFDCENGRACRAVQFHASYEMSPPSLEQLNAWNRDHRYGRAFVANNNFPSLEMDVDLEAAGGMSRPLFIDNLQLFVSLLPQFEELIGWQR